MIESLTEDHRKGPSDPRWSRVLVLALVVCFVAKVAILAFGSPREMHELSRALSLVMVVLPIVLLPDVVRLATATRTKRGLLVAAFCVPPCFAVGELVVSVASHVTSATAPEEGTSKSPDEWAELRKAALGGNSDVASVAGLKGTRSFRLDEEMGVTLERGFPGRARVKAEVASEQRDRMEHYLASPVPYGLAEGEWWFKVEDRSPNGLPQLPVRRPRFREWVKGSSSRSDLVGRIRDLVRVLRGMATPEEEASRVHEDPDGDFLFGWGLQPEGLALNEESHMVEWRGLKPTSRSEMWGLRLGDVISGMGPLESIGVGRAGLAVGGATLRGLCGYADRSAGTEGLKVRVWRGSDLIWLTPEVVPVRIDDVPIGK